MSDNTEMQAQDPDPNVPVLSESQIADGPIRTALVRRPRSGDTRADNLLSSGSVKTGEDLPPGQVRIENRQQIQRFRIAVDHNRFISFIFQSESCVNTGIIEFYSLADSIRAATKNHHLFIR